MSSFVAKMEKPTYANVRFIKQTLGIHSDEELLKFMSFSTAKELDAQLKQLQASKEEENDTESTDSK